MSRFILIAACLVLSFAGGLVRGDEPQVIFHDAFDRDDADAVGNEWTSRGTAVLKDQALFFELSEEEFRPRTQRTFALQKSGKFTATFVMDWLRETEGTWSFHMQLGHSAEFPRLLIREEDLSKGIAVNLLWGGREPVNFEPFGSFGYRHRGKFKPLLVLNDGQNKGSVVDKPVVSIAVDMDAATYAVTMSGKTYADLPFDNQVPIDTIRFISNGCSKSGFSRTSIDDVKITREQ